MIVVWIIAGVIILLCVVISILDYSPFPLAIGLMVSLLFLLISSNISYTTAKNTEVRESEKEYISVSTLPLVAVSTDTSKDEAPFFYTQEKVGEAFKYHVMAQSEEGSGITPLNLPGRTDIREDSEDGRATLEILECRFVDDALNEKFNANDCGPKNYTIHVPKGTLSRMAELDLTH